MVAVARGKRHDSRVSECHMCACLAMIHGVLTFDMIMRWLIAAHGHHSEQDVP